METHHEYSSVYTAIRNLQQLVAKSRSENERHYTDLCLRIDELESIVPANKPKPKLNFQPSPAEDADTLDEISCHDSIVSNLFRPLIPTVLW